MVDIECDEMNSVGRFPSFNVRGYAWVRPYALV